MTVTLSMKREPDIPLELESIIPSNIVGRSLTEIRQIPIIQGNTTPSVGEFFKISGEAPESLDACQITFKGDLRKVKMIGKGMDGGRIRVEGTAGMHLGSEMISGRIEVLGSVGSWAAAEMKGGNIQIEGDAGDCLCAGYRGSMEGMIGGRVYVKGNVGKEAGSHMRRGFIAIKGNVDTLCASRMMGGTIIVCGSIASRVGVEATRGMIFALDRIESVLPSYRISGVSEREFTGYYLKYLQSRRPDFLSDVPDMEEKWIRIVGDFAEGDPRMEFFALENNNEHLF